MIDQNQPGPHELAEAALESRLTAALEAAPVPVVPSDFAQRVMKVLPVLKAARGDLRISFTASRFGRRFALAALAALLVAIFALTLQPQSSQSLALRAVEWSFELEIILLTVWLALRPTSLG